MQPNIRLHFRFHLSKCMHLYCVLQRIAGRPRQCTNIIIREDVLNKIEAILLITF